MMNETKFKKRKRYIITGGYINGKVEVSVVDIAQYSGLSHSTVYSRLARGVFDLDALCKVVGKRVSKKKKKYVPPINRLLLQKPFYDPMFRLMLRVI